MVGPFTHRLADHVSAMLDLTKIVLSKLILLVVQFVHGQAREQELQPVITHQIQAPKREQ